MSSIFETPARIQRTHWLPSAAGARTAFFATRLGFCLAVPHRAAQGAEIRMMEVSAPR